MGIAQKANRKYETLGMYFWSMDILSVWIQGTPGSDLETDARK
jgi:hypothetical protein